jgi:hypothetical protein
MDLRAPGAIRHGSARRRRGRRRIDPDGVGEPHRGATGTAISSEHVGVGGAEEGVERGAPRPKRFPHRRSYPP